MIKPTKDRIFIELNKGEHITDGGIYIPEQEGMKRLRGKVKAVGPGKVLKNGQRSTFNVKVGDEVYLDFRAGIPVNYKGEEFVVVTEPDILGIVE